MNLSKAENQRETTKLIEEKKKERGECAKNDGGRRKFMPGRKK